MWARSFDIFHVSHVPRHGISANVRTSVLSSTLVFCLCIHLQVLKVSALWRGANFVFTLLEPRSCSNIHTCV